MRGEPQPSPDGPERRMLMAGKLSDSSALPLTPSSPDDPARASPPPVIPALDCSPLPGPPPAPPAPVEAPAGARGARMLPPAPCSWLPNRPLVLIPPGCVDSCRLTTPLPGPPARASPAAALGTPRWPKALPAATVVEAAAGSRGLPKGPPICVHRESASNQDNNCVDREGASSQDNKPVERGSQSTDTVWNSCSSVPRRAAVRPHKEPRTGVLLPLCLKNYLCVCVGVAATWA